MALLIGKLKIAGDQLYTSLMRTAWRNTRSYGTRQESKPWRQKPNRKARLKVILTQDVHNLGVRGQIVEVKHGFGRNRLIPHKMAVYATQYNIKEHKAFIVEKGATKVDEVDYLVDYLSSKELTVRVPPFKTNVVTERHISKAFRQNLQLHVPLDCIELSDPVTDFTRENSVMVRLNEDTLVAVPVIVNTSFTKKEQRMVDKQNAFLSRIANKENS